MFGMDPILAGICIGAGGMLILWIIVLTTESRERSQHAADEREFVETVMHDNIRLTRDLMNYRNSVQYMLSHGESHQYGKVVYDLHMLESNLRGCIQIHEGRGVQIREYWKKITQREPH